MVSPYIWKAGPPPGYYYDRVQQMHREDIARQARIREEQQNREWQASMRRHYDLIIARQATQRPPVVPTFRVADVPRQPTEPFRMTPELAARLVWTQSGNDVLRSLGAAAAPPPVQPEWDAFRSTLGVPAHAPNDWQRLLGIDSKKSPWDILESAAVAGPFPLAQSAQEIPWNSRDNRWHQLPAQPAKFPLFATFQGAVPQFATAVDLSALQASVPRVPEAPAYVGQFPEFDASFNRQVALGNAVEYQRVGDLPFLAPRFVDFHT